MMRTKQIRRNKPAKEAGEVPESVQDKPQAEITVAEAQPEPVQEAQEGVTSVPDVPNQPDVPSVPDAAPVVTRKRSKRQPQVQAE